MKTIILLHGVFVTDVVWAIMKPSLEQYGYNVITPTLPGHGDDPTPHSEINLDTYINFMVEQVKSVNSKVTLVAHSMSGMIISGVAESFIELLQTDTDCFLGKHIEFDPETGAKLNLGQLIDTFAADFPIEIPDTFIKEMRLEPIQPLIDKISLTEENFGSVSKYYIETMHDHTISNNFQKTMIEKATSSLISDIARAFGRNNC
jgi:hypothetical protein